MFSKVKTVKVSIDSSSVKEEKTEVETKQYTYKDIQLAIPTTWGNGSTASDMLSFDLGERSFMIYSGDLDGVELSQKKADKLVKKEYANICDSIKITNSNTYEYNKKIGTYYVYNISMEFASYTYEYTGRTTMSPDGTMSMYNKKKYTIPCKGRITIFEYNGKYYVAVMSIINESYKKSSFDDYKDVIKSIKPRT